MGGANDVLTESEKERLTLMAQKLGDEIARRQCVLVTGATTGVPAMVSCAAQKAGALTVGISPAINETEHASLYNLPTDGIDLIIHTGFGIKGRNVINIRSSDIVIILGGAMGTLNEFTIAFDEGKIIGVLSGSGGVADHIGEIIELAKKPTRAKVIYGDSPVLLLGDCIRAFEERGNQDEIFGVLQ
jgi:hypothetical protein